MIVYPLACGGWHFFEGWFASAEACERQAARGIRGRATLAEAAELAEEGIPALAVPTEVLPPGEIH